MNKNRFLPGLLALSLCLPGTLIAASKPAEPSTAKANAAVLTQLDFNDQQAFDDARRDFIATAPHEPLLNPDASAAWNVADYAFLA